VCIYDYLHRCVYIRTYVHRKTCCLSGDLHGRNGKTPNQTLTKWCCSNNDTMTQTQASSSSSPSPSLCHEGELEAVKGLVELAGIFCSGRESYCPAADREEATSDSGMIIENTVAPRKRTENGGRGGRRKQPILDCANGDGERSKTSGMRGLPRGATKAAVQAGMLYISVSISIHMHVCIRAHVYFVRAPKNK
jgi:hypothetical protein